MADNDLAARKAWVARYLGVTLTPPTRGVVNYAILLLEWRRAQSSAAASLSALGQALLASEEVQNDPRIATVRRAVEMLPNLVPEFGDKLADELDAAMTAGGTEAGKAHLRDAAKTLAGYRTKLSAVPVLAQLGGFAKRTVGLGLTAHADLDAALSKLEREVAARIA